VALQVLIGDTPAHGAGGRERDEAIGRLDCRGRVTAEELGDDAPKT
jgi:hypothetical protein